MKRRIVKWAAHAAAAATLALLPGMAAAQTLKVVMHSDVKIIDPFWTTAYIVRNYGYMVYDTLLAVDDSCRSSRKCWKAGRLATTSSPTPSPCATA